MRHSNGQHISFDTIFLHFLFRETGIKLEASDFGCEYRILWNCPEKRERVCPVQRRHNRVLVERVLPSSSEVAGDE
jgi:hypothetical protein